jgi:hypothetical protein
MAKRARGAGGRPGQRRSNQRSANRPQNRPSAAPTAARAASLAPVDEPAADVADTAAERPAGSSRGRTRTTSAAFEDSTAQEYAYVAADVRRIAIVGGSLFAVLIALFVLIEVVGVIKI